MGLKEILLLCFLLQVFALKQLSAQHSGSSDGVQQACYNISNMEGLNVTKFMKQQWYEQQRTQNNYEGSEQCQNISYTINGNNFMVKLSPEIKWLGKIYTKEQMIQFNSSEPDMLFNYTVVDTDYENMAVVYACHQNSKTIEEYVWILSQQSVLQSSDPLELPAIKNNPRLADLLTGNDGCSQMTTAMPTDGSDTPTLSTDATAASSQGTGATTLGTESSTDATTLSTEGGTDATTIGSEGTPTSTKGPESTTAASTQGTDATTISSEGTPTSTKGPESTTAQEPDPTGIKGFHIPNSNRTFYFELQFH